MWVTSWVKHIFLLDVSAIVSLSLAVGARACGLQPWVAGHSGLGGVSAACYSVELCTVCDELGHLVKQLPQSSLNHERYCWTLNLFLMRWMRSVWWRQDRQRVLTTLESQLWTLPSTKRLSTHYNFMYLLLRGRGVESLCLSFSPRMFAVY